MCLLVFRLVLGIFIQIASIVARTEFLSMNKYTMNKSGNDTRREFEKHLDRDYQLIEKGHCMLSANYGESNQVSICNGKIVSCHAISRNQLNLIADNVDDPNHIIAVKERRSFLEEANRGNHLQRTSIGKFSAGNWACEKHENDFKNIDCCQIDLSSRENILNTVLRVVCRHNLLMQLRWFPIYKHCQTDLGWQQIIEHGFIDSISDEEAEVFLRKWRDFASAVNSMAQYLIQKIREKDWNCLQIRTCMLKSKPTVAGWGCSYWNDPLNNHHIDLAYLIAIPQEYGHALITACKSSDQFRLNDITKIHSCIPYDSNPHKLHIACSNTRKLLSNWIWGANELGIRPTFYNSWDDSEKNKVDKWFLRDEKTKKSVWNGISCPSDLPLLFPTC